MQLTQTSKISVPGYLCMYYLVPFEERVSFLKKVVVRPCKRLHKVPVVAVGVRRVDGKCGRQPYHDLKEVDRTHHWAISKGVCHRLFEDMFLYTSNAPHHKDQSKTLMNYSRVFSTMLDFPAITGAPTPNKTFFRRALHNINPIVEPPCCPLTFSLWRHFY